MQNHVVTSENVTKFEENV